MTPIIKDSEHILGVNFNIFDELPRPFFKVSPHAIDTKEILSPCILNVNMKYTILIPGHSIPGRFNGPVAVDLSQQHPNSLEGHSSGAICSVDETYSKDTKS